MAFIRIEDAERQLGRVKKERRKFSVCRMFQLKVNMNIGKDQYSDSTRIGPSIGPPLSAPSSEQFKKVLVQGRMMYLKLSNESEKWMHGVILLVQKNFNFQNFI